VKAKVVNPNAAAISKRYLCTDVKINCSNAKPPHKNGEVLNI
jgi:hypothetical protein